MASIESKNLCLEFPVFGCSYRSFKTAAIAKMSGGIVKSDNDTVIVQALKDISFSLSDGDRLGLVGNNGSGKTSLLRCLAGSYKPTTGSLLVNGSVSSMISISLGLENDATGVENIKLRGALLGLTKTQVKNLIDDVTEFAELGQFINLPMRTYSSGMLMRLAFGIATGIQSDIILMDEWMSVGDANFASKSENRLNMLLDNAKILVIASHNSKLVEKLCTQVIHLEEGRVLSHKEILNENT